MNAFFKTYLTIIASILPAIVNAECMDNANFTFTTKAGFEQNCSWIQENVERAERYCVSSHPFYNYNVYKNCPLACSAVPSVTYTDTDGHEFPLIYSGALRPCDWITYNPDHTAKRMGKYCNFDQQMMDCPATCGCATIDDGAPSMEPSENPSMSPSKLRCTDLPETYEFEAAGGGKGPYTCGWLTQSNKEVVNQRRKELYCTEEHQLYACAGTCGLCSQEPSSAPTSNPSTSQVPSKEHSNSPSLIPSNAPSDSPSKIPSASPSLIPSNAPSDSKIPSDNPSMLPSLGPSDSPSMVPSNEPSRPPSPQPSPFPTSPPSFNPTSSIKPSMQPSVQPSASIKPSTLPSMQPSDQPSQIPTTPPSLLPSSTPSDSPSQRPTRIPSENPTNGPTGSIKPSPIPTFTPSTTPTVFPTNAPTHSPSTTTCTDDEEYEFNRTPDSLTATMVDCKYMCKNQYSEKNEARQEKWCTGEVLDKCCASCSAVARCS